MNYIVSAMCVAGLLMVTLTPDAGLSRDNAAISNTVAVLPAPSSSAAPLSTAPDDIVQEYCVRCHNERRLTGNLSLEDFTLESADEVGDVTERMIR